jgi:hypothetical protein
VREGEEGRPPLSFRCCWHTRWDGRSHILAERGGGRGQNHLLGRRKSNVVAEGAACGRASSPICMQLRSRFDRRLHITLVSALGGRDAAQATGRHTEWRGGHVFGENLQELGRCGLRRVNESCSSIISGRCGFGGLVLRGGYIAMLMCLCERETRGRRCWRKPGGGLWRKQR